MTQTKKRSRPGRPKSETPKVAMRGKGRLLSANVPLEVYESLLGASDQSGRSVSQVASRWLEDASAGRAQYLDLIGGSGLAPVVEQLVAIARTVQAKEPNPDLARTAIIAAWKHATPGLLLWTLDLTAQADVIAEAMKVRQACGAVTRVLGEAPKDDPVLCRALAPLSSRNPLAPAKPLAKRLVDVLTRGATVWPDELTVHALEELRSAGHTAGKEIEEALSLARPFAAELAEWIERHRRARELGEAIARTPPYSTSPEDDQP